MHIDVPHPGKMLAVRGGYTRMHLCQECDGNESHESQTPPPPTKGLLTAWPEKVKKIREILFALKNGSACGPNTVFFSQNVSHIFSHCCQRFFSHIFRDFFAHFFALLFALLFSQNFSHVTFTHFSNTFVQSCVAHKVFIVCSLSIA